MNKIGQYLRCPSCESNEVEEIVDELEVERNKNVTCISRFCKKCLNLQSRSVEISDFGWHYHANEMWKEWNGVFFSREEMNLLQTRIDKIVVFESCGGLDD